MNKKLVKRVAIASLAALMSIPNLTVPMNNNTNIVYAATPMDTYQQNIKHAQEMVDKFKKEGNEEGVKNWTKNLEKWIAASQSPEVKEAEQIVQNAMASAAQNEAQRQADQVEKDRIANTIYPLHARYVKDFVPAVDDHKPHYYERPDLPGVIFTLRQDEWGNIFDEKPHVNVKREAPDWIVYSNPADDKTLKFKSTFKQFVVSYTSPFNFMGIATLHRAYIEPNQLYVEGGFPHHIGENMEYQISVLVDKTYDEGFPAEYIGKTVGSMPQDKDKDIAFNGGKPKPFTLQDMRNFYEGTPGFKMTSKEKLTQSSYVKYNKEHGGAWIDEKDIYQIAQEFGTDYTDEERPLYDIRKKQSEMTEDERRLTNRRTGEMISLDLDPATGEIKKSTFNNDKSFWNR